MSRRSNSKSPTGAEVFGHLPWRNLAAGPSPVANLNRWLGHSLACLCAKEAAKHKKSGLSNLGQRGPTIEKNNFTNSRRQHVNIRGNNADSCRSHYHVSCDNEHNNAEPEPTCDRQGICLCLCAQHPSPNRPQRLNEQDVLCPATPGASSFL